MEVVWQTNRSIKTARFFEITSKRRNGYPSETQVKRGFRVVHGDKELREKLGRSRTIRDDARLYFRRTTLCEDDEVQENGVWKDDEPRYRDSYSTIDPDEGDYARVVQLINEFLPVREMAGRLIGVPVLRQFGLIENEKVDHFLATVFSKSPGSAEDSLNRPREQRARDKAKAVRGKQVRR